MAKRSAKASPPKPANVVAQARGKGKPPHSFAHVVWDNAKSLAGALLIYLVIKTFLMEAFRIPSGSMIPTLLVGDWLFVNKAVYGAHIPFTNSNLPGYRDPTRGDVMVFQSPYQADNGDDPTPTLVKRLIGMPGDTLFMRSAVVYVNGIAQRQGFAFANNYRGDSAEYNPDFEWQHTIELKGTRFGSPPAKPTHDNWGPLLIPAGHYFMMGDNRYCSKDSRYWGVVPRENVRGRPMFVYYSYVPGPNPLEPLDPCGGEVSSRPLPPLTNIRWGRIGTRIR
ncbi:MAG TPA: signal peptidase I [Gemmatimonadaceae bacterium]|nr:signal peptidase I [Gemmatimonadaceae bacterium]